ncbi:MAG: ABC-2 family transporter protein [Chlamydiales bacterium]|nr:ABC-2 family transporter protein [Chlamydiales bacterium]
MTAFNLYWRYLSVVFQAKMQYPLSFVMVTLAAFISSCAELLGFIALFARFDNIMGWHLEEVALLYGICKMSLNIWEVIGRGFDQFGAMVKSGDFDIFLLRPRATALQVAGQEIHVNRLGSVLQAFLVLTWASIQLKVGPLEVVLLVFAIAGGTCLFYGLFVMQATICFWTTEGLEVMNILTFGGSDLGQYPITIYEKWFRRLFTFIVPIACISYFPLLTILGRDDTFLGTPWWLGWLTPISGFVFLVFSFFVWNVGVRHYRSTGS